MAKKTSSEVIPGNAFDTGLLTVSRFDGTDLPSPGSEITVAVHSTVLDRFEGTASTELVWGEHANMKVITSATVNNAVRKECADFFIRRRIVGVLRGLIQPRMVRPDDVMIVKADLQIAIFNDVKDQVVTNVIMELVVPYLTKVGVLSKHGDYSRRVRYYFSPVDVMALTHDVSMFEIVRVMERAKVINIADRKYSKEVFADEVGDALSDIGRSFLDINMLGSVMDDIVKGIRAYVDLGGSGVTGIVDSSWRNNSVVASLATNWIFLRAALQLPFGSSITPVNDGWKLDKYAPEILAALKSSARYAIVGKAEVARNIGTKKVRDVRGRPISVVLWRSAKPDAVGMSLYAYEDSVLPGAYTLTATKERLGEVIAAAYGDVSNLGTDYAARMLHSSLSHAAEAGYIDGTLLYQIDLGGYATVENDTLAALMSERVVIAIDSNGMVVTHDDDSVAKPIREDGLHDEEPVSSPAIKMWFTVRTNEKDLTWLMSGRFDGDSYLTSSPAEVFLVMDELSPLATIESKPQLYGQNSFNTRIVNFDSRSVRQISQRFGFNVNVYNVEVHGAFRASDLGSMKSNPDTSMVVPEFNHDVFNCVANTFDTILNLAAKLRKATASGLQAEYDGGDHLAAYIERNAAKHVLRYAQSLSPAFRAEIHRGIMSRATRLGTLEQSMKLRAKLAQRAFGAYADVVALVFFLEMQGMTTVADFWTKCISDSTMAQVYFEAESDRPAATL